MKKKSIWKKSLVFSLIAAMVLSLMPAEAFLTEVKADESYGNIVNSENGVGGSVKSDHILSDNMKPESLQKDNDSKDGQVLPAVISRGTLTDKDVFFEDTETSGRAEESDQVISFVTDDGRVLTKVTQDPRKGGYIKNPIDFDVPQADPNLSYQEARSLLVNDPNSDVKGSITNSYDFNIPEAYPASYDDEEDLNDYLKNVLPPVRDQARAGNCWAMSIMGLMENYMLANGLEDRNGKVSVKATDTLPGINYSELQLVYFYNRSNKFPNVDLQKGDYIEPREGYKLDYLGGHQWSAMGVMLNGIGAVDEALIPYSTYMKFTTDDQRAAVSGMDDEFMYHQDVANLINAYFISIYDNVNQVKQAVMQNHAVGISYVPGEDDRYYNAENNAQYNYIGDGSSGGHAVCIVGWDDNFPAQNFSGKDGNGPIPRNDGAWLIRNSYTDTLGRDIDVLNYDCYFWMSYEDASIGEPAYVYEAGISDYDNNYSHNAVYNYGYGYLAPADTVANVFEVRGEKSAPEETVTAAVIKTPHADVDYSVTVYSVDEDGNPLEPLNEATTGKIVYPGMYTIPLSDPVTLSRGEKFAIVVTTAGGYVSIEQDTDWGKTFVHVGKNEGESLFFLDGGWYEYSINGCGNFIIQALTVNEGLEENPNITGMKISGRSEDSISVSWDPFPGAAYYYVFRSVGELEAYRDLSSYKPIALIPSASGATFYTDTKVPRNSHCVYYVVAADDTGSLISDKSRFVAAEPVAVYDPDLKAGKIFETSFGNSTYGLIGDANSGEYFIFQYKKEGDTEWTEWDLEIGEFFDSENDNYERWWSFNKDLLEPGTYDFLITPYKINLYGERILGETFTDKFYSHYPAPKNAVGRYSTVDKTLTVSWDPVEGAPGYVVLNWESDNSAYYYCAVTDADTCSVTISELEYKEGIETIQDDRVYNLAIFVYDEDLCWQGYDPMVYSLGTKLSFETYLTPDKFTVDAEDCVYDGDFHPVTIAPLANIPEGDIGEITVFYAKVEGVVNSADSEEDGEGYEELIYSEWSEDAPKDAGDYLFGIIAEDGAGYPGAPVTSWDWMFTISKADIVVTPEDGQAKEEDDEEDVITYFWSPAAGSEEPGFTGSLSREEGETPGEYEINIGTLELADNGDFKESNYNLVFTEGGIFTITPVAALEKMSVSAETTPTTVNLSWEAVPKANGYAIFVGDDTEPVCTTAMLSYKMTGLTPDSEYSFVIYPYRSDDITQYSDSSATVNVKTAAPGILSPDNFRFSAEPAVYDKNSHGATVVPSILGTEIGDITVYYRKSGSSIEGSDSGSEMGSGSGSALGSDTGNSAWTEIIPVEAGKYDVAIDVAAVIEYQGAEKLTDASWIFEIKQKEVDIEWSTDQFVYNENAQVPSVTLTGVLEGDACTASVSGEATGAGTYTATVTGLSNTNYRLPENASVTFVIDKGNRTAPGAPEAEKVLATSITLKSVIGYEYRMNDGEWQTDSVFLSLEQGKEYSFYQRIAGDEDHNASEASPALKVTTKVHAHEWEFSSEGAVITATCKNTDGGHTGNTGSAESSGNTAKLTVIKPQHEVFGDGKPETAMVEGSIDGVETPEIIYMKGDEVLTEAPTACGTYKACIVIGNGAAEAVTASVDYTIDKADPVIKTAPVAKTDLVFTNLKQELVTAGEAEGGTILYALVSGSDSVPGEDAYSADMPGAENAGIYTVYYKVKGDENHKDTEPDKLIVIISDRSSSTVGNSVVYVYVESGNNTGSSGNTSGSTSGNTSSGTSSENESSGTSSGKGSDSSNVSSESGAGSGKTGDKKDDESPKVTKYTDNNKDGSTVETTVTEYADGLKETEIVKKNKKGKETERSFTSENVTKKGTKITNSVQHLADGTIKSSMIKEYKSGKKDIEIYEYQSEEKVSYSHQILNTDGSMTAIVAVMDTEDNAFITTTVIKKDGTTVVKKYEAKLNAGEDEDSEVPGSAKLVDYITSTKTVKVPDLIKENGLVLKINAIAKELFAGNEKITAASIGANVSVIEERAFYNAKKLKKVYIYSQELSDIGENAFSGIAKKATFYIKAKDEEAFNSVVKLIKDSGVGKKVRFKMIQK